MQDKYVLHSRLFRGGRKDQDAPQKANNYKPHIRRKPDGVIP
jgi:hypothetical protein